MTAVWKERPEGGNDLAFRFGRAFSLRFGRNVARLALHPAALYFFLRRAPERRASREYLARILDRPPGWLDVMRHVHCFSSTTLDRLFLLTERFRRFEIRTFGLADLDRVLEGGKGVLLFGSHLGSFEALRVLSLERPDVSVRILLDIDQGPTLSRTLNALNPALAATVINARDAGPTVAIAIEQALARNSIVALLADRALSGQAVQRVDFLGDPAPFPVAPWLLAAALKAPVMLAFGLYRGGNRYDLHFEPFAECITMARAERATLLPQILQRFADRLAHHARLAPYNWFNFYDFWHDSSGGAPRGAADGAGDLLRRS